MNRRGFIQGCAALFAAVAVPVKKAAASAKLIFGGKRIVFTNIPAGTKRITVYFQSVSEGMSNIELRVNCEGIESSGYLPAPAADEPAQSGPNTA